MQTRDTATRIVAIDSELRGHLAPSLRVELQQEQSRLWESEYRGQPYETICYDAWLVRRR